MDTVAEIEELKQAEEKLTEHTKELLAQYEEPLTFTSRDSQGEPITAKAHNVYAYSTVETGVLWIPPFEYDFWSWRHKKPQPIKCTCECGHTHTVKKGKEPRTVTT